MTMNQKRAWLESYRLFRREAEDIAERIVRLRSEAERMSARLTGLPGGGPGDDRLQRCAAELADLSDDYERKYRKAIRRAKEIERAVARISSPMYRTVLRRKYIDGLTWIQIGDEIGYSERSIHYIAAAATKAL